MTLLHWSEAELFLLFDHYLAIKANIILLQLRAHSIDYHNTYNFKLAFYPLSALQGLDNILLQLPPRFRLQSPV